MQSSPTIQPSHPFEYMRAPEAPHARRTPCDWLHKISVYFNWLVRKPFTPFSRNSFVRRISHAGDARALLPAALQRCCWCHFWIYWCECSLRSYYIRRCRAARNGCGSKNVLAFWIIYNNRICKLCVDFGANAYLIPNSVDSFSSCCYCCFAVRFERKNMLKIQKQFLFFHRWQEMLKNRAWFYELNLMIMYFWWMMVFPFS